MKNLVYLLVLVNLVFFAWHFRYNPPEVAPHHQPVPELPPNVNSLVLLQERTDKDALKGLGLLDSNERNTYSGSTTRTSPPPGIVLTCYAIGPFREVQEAAQVSARLQQRGLNPSLRNQGVEMPPRFWVFLPPMPIEEIEKVKEQLVSNGINDFFVGSQNIVSLGMFSELELAEQRKSAVDALGYGPKIEKQSQSRGEYWLDIIEAGEARITVSELKEVFGSHHSARLQIITCE